MIEATVNGWFKALFTGGLFPQVLPQDHAAWPAAVYERLSEQVPTDGGAPFLAEGWRIRLTIWSDKYKSLKDVAATVRASLEQDRAGYRLSVEDSDDGYNHQHNLYFATFDFYVEELVTL